MWRIYSSYAKIIILYGYSISLNKKLIGLNKGKILKLSSYAYGNKVRMVQNSVGFRINIKGVWGIIKSSWTIITLTFVKEIRVHLVDKYVKMQN